jgi:hypothetical protein
MSNALQAAVRKSLISGNGHAFSLALQMHTDHPAKGTEIQRFALLLATNELGAARSLVNDRVAAAMDDKELWVVYDMLLDLRERSLGPLDLDANAVDQLQSIANSEAIGAAQAQAWLALLGEPIKEVVWLPNQNKRLKPQREHEASTARPLLGAYPNPSNGPVYFTYPVAEGVEQVELRLHDASGRLIGDHRLATKAGIMELDRRDLPTGLVIANLYWDGIRVADAKVSLVK